ncbi:MAG TPA: orotidine-5'-phosphate decarboxylase [Pyrinomonadaceae bacterium]|nr:orotidine-5'-phosphate decarboxylase [Pyrinomonadaceae bacterium]
MRAAKDKLIVALDVDSMSRALDLFAELRDIAGMFKIGSQLFTAAGPDIVRQIISRGGRIFLDLKFHDIPNTVAAAGVEATRLGVSIFNVHASGGAEMLKRTTAAVNEVSVKESLAKPKVIAVTLLTSIDQNTLALVGILDDPRSVVSSWAQLAADCGLDGVVASPQEIEIIRAAVDKPDFVIVTPGIRPAADAADDQRRVRTAAEAIRAGADYLVVGRPILNAADPAAAANRIVSQIDAALP